MFGTSLRSHDGTNIRPGHDRPPPKEPGEHEGRVGTVALLLRQHHEQIPRGDIGALLMLSANTNLVIQRKPRYLRVRLGRCETKRGNLSHRVRTYVSGRVFNQLPVSSESTPE